MNLFRKIDSRIDYNSDYSIRKALDILGREFNLAVSKQNVVLARDVIYTVRMVHNKLSSLQEGMKNPNETERYLQKRIMLQMKRFVAYLTHRMKSEFGVRDHDEEIEQTISGE